MAKRGQTITLPAGTEISDPDEESPLSDAAQQIKAIEEEDIADALIALQQLDSGGGVQWTVHRTTAPPNVPTGYCGTLTSEELSPARIQQFGRGKYKVKGYKPGHGYVGQRTFDIAIDPPKESVANGGNGTTGVTDVLAIIRADKEAKSADFKAWATILVPTLGPALLNLFAPRKQESMADMVQALAGLKTLSGGDTQANALENFLKMLETAKNLIGDDKPATGSTWIDVAREVIMGAKPMLERISATGLPGVPASGLNQPIRPSPQLSAPLSANAVNPLTPANAVSSAEIAPSSVTAEVAAPSSPASESDMLIQMLPWLRHIMTEMSVQAKRAKSPELYAEVILDNVPTGIDIATLKPYLERADWWPMLCHFAPAVEPYPAWFEELRKELISGIEEEIAERTRETSDRGHPDETGDNT